MSPYDCHTTNDCDREPLERDFSAEVSEERAERQARERDEQITNARRSSAYGI